MTDKPVFGWQGAAVPGALSPGLIVSSLPTTTDKPVLGWQGAAGTYPRTSVKDFGAVGDGTTDDTVAINAALWATRLGGAVYFPPGSYKHGTCFIYDGSQNLTIYGPGATQLLPGACFGFQFLGTCQNISLEDMIIIGDNVLADDQIAVLAGIGVHLTNINISGLAIKDVVVGIDMNLCTHGGDEGLCNGMTIEGNYLENILGTLASSGYGIVLSCQSSSPALCTISNNTIVAAQRHSIYAGSGSGFLITGNEILDHGSTGWGYTDRPAIVISRVSNVVVSQNLVSNYKNGAISIDTDGGLHCHDITVSDNVFSMPSTAVSAVSHPSIFMGWDGSGGLTTDVYINGNTVVSDGLDGVMVRVFDGKRIFFDNNSFSARGFTGAGDIFEIQCKGEVGPSNTYSDDIYLRNNTFVGEDDGGITSGIGLLTEAKACISNMTFDGNTFMGVDNTFDAGVVTNPNITILNQPSDGITLP